MEKVKYGNCYQFNIPDEFLNAEETGQVLDSLLFDLKRTPIGETFVLDISIGPDTPEDLPWEEFVTTRRAFKRAEFIKREKSIARDDMLHFLREHFADMLTLPAPKLKRIK